MFSGNYKIDCETMLGILSKYKYYVGSINFPSFPKFFRYLILNSFNKLITSEILSFSRSSFKENKPTL